MVKYNFKKFFNTGYQIADDEFVCNGYFLIKRSCLKKTQNEYVSTFPKSDKIELVKGLYKKAQETETNNDSTEFIPAFLGEEKDSKDLKPYNVVLTEDNRAIKEEYYNFFKDLKCRIFYYPKCTTFTPIPVYKDKFELVGVILPVNLKDSLNNKINYTDYLNKQKEQTDQDKQRKQKIKKCLYISDNKAIVRNKELTCIAELVNDEAYKNLYVESDYKKDGGMVFIDFGFILMYMKHLSKYDVEPKDIIYSLEKVKDYTFDDYKNYITDCLNNNQFINVAEIKLMELAGESAEYIKTLIDHRQKVIDMREQKHKEQEAKREKENQAYVAEQNKKAEDIINNAEQAIINKQNVANKDITIYKSKYESSTTSLILYLMKKYDINVPLKVQGWINKVLANIVYDAEYDDYSYQYYKSSADSKAFAKYLYQLVYKIKEKHGIITVAS